MPGLNVDARDVCLVTAVAGEAIAGLGREKVRRSSLPRPTATRATTTATLSTTARRRRCRSRRATFDPIINARDWLISDGLATQAEIDAVDREVDKETEAAIAWAETGPIASPITPEEIYASY